MKMAAKLRQQAIGSLPESLLHRLVRAVLRGHNNDPANVSMCHPSDSVQKNPGPFHKGKDPHPWGKPMPMLLVSQVESNGQFGMEIVRDCDDIGIRQSRHPLLAWPPFQQILALLSRHFPSSSGRDIAFLLPSDFQHNSDPATTSIRLPTRPLMPAGFSLSVVDHLLHHRLVGGGKLEVLLRSGVRLSPAAARCA